jgi:hypothetical protein
VANEDSSCGREASLTSGRHRKCVKGGRFGLVLADIVIFGGWYARKRMRGLEGRIYLILDELKG